MALAFAWGWQNLSATQYTISVLLIHCYGSTSKVNLIKRNKLGIIYRLRLRKSKYSYFNEELTSVKKNCKQCLMVQLLTYPDMGKCTDSVCGTFWILGKYFVRLSSFLLNISAEEIFNHDDLKLAFFYTIVIMCHNFIYMLQT